METRNIKLENKIYIDEKSLWKKFSSACLLIGSLFLVFWIIGMIANPIRAMYGYLFAYVSVISISLGCMIFVLLQHLTRAGWSIAVRRVPELAMAAMPLFVLLFIPIAFFAQDIFSWADVSSHDSVLKAKAPYLNLPFFLIRSFVYLIAWTLIGVWFYRRSIGQDKSQKASDSMRTISLSAPSVIVFAITLSFASFDWLMSLEPHWFSTIFGVYFFSGCILSGLSFMVLVYMALQYSGFVEKSITTEHYHDLGKLIFGFTIFWAYIAFSQFMLYWYTNIPEETEFYIHRLHHGWEVVSWSLPVLHFYLPFFVLLSRHVKRYKPCLFIACVWIILMQFVDIYWIVLPNFNGSLCFSWLDIFALVGILFLFLSYVGFLLTKQMILPIGDPRIKESIAFENF